MYADQRIEFAASSRIEDALKGQGHVNVTSYNYTVLLTGEVPTAQAKADVEKIVSEVPQVKTVVNELQVAGASSSSSRSNDAYITSKVKSNFLGNDKFKPTDIKVVTEASVVYLLGLVTREEADAATRDCARHRRGAESGTRVRIRRSVPAPDEAERARVALGRGPGRREHPLDLADELAVVGLHRAAEGQHAFAAAVDKILVEVPVRPFAGLLASEA